MVVAEITEAGVQHVVVVIFTRTLDITTTGQSLYHADLRADLAGIYPFTGAESRETHFTDLLWNNRTSSIVFNSDD